MAERHRPVRQAARVGQAGRVPSTADDTEKVTGIPALQRAAGNRAVSALLGHQVPVQRAPRKPDIVTSAQQVTLDLHPDAVKPGQPKQPGWRAAKLAPGQSQVVYILRDKTSGEVLKVGKSTVGAYKARFAEYVTAGNKHGRRLAVDVYTLRKRSGKGIEAFESEIRAGMEKAGHRLLWDNTRQPGVGRRLGRKGGGIPEPAGDRLKFIDQVEKQLKAQKAGSKTTGVTPSTTGGGGAGNTNDDDTHPSRSVRRLGGGLGGRISATIAAAGLGALKAWSLAALDKRNATKSKADSQRIQNEIGLQIDAKAEWIVDQWIDYDFLTYATVTVDTKMKYHTHAEHSIGPPSTGGMPTMSGPPTEYAEYIEAKLVSVDVGKTARDTRAAKLLASGGHGVSTWELKLERETVSWLIPEDAEALRSRLEERIAVVEELMIKEPYSGSLALAKDHLRRRLELVGP